MSETENRKGRLLALHPVLMAGDVTQSVHFFKCLGFVLVFQDSDSEPRYAVIRRDAVEIHLQWNDAVHVAATYDRPTYRFLVDDVDRLFSEFVTTAPELLSSEQQSPWYQPADTPWGTREFHVLDPAGNGLQFYRAT